MAGISQGTRDLDAVASGLTRWFTSRRPGATTRLSPFTTNPSSGYSSESLLFELTSDGNDTTITEQLVLRLPPAGGGLFPEYDLGRQAATQNLVARAHLPAPSPAVHEPDPSWIGTAFLVMPRIGGRIPGDYSYLFKGWLKDASPELQRDHYLSFVDALTALHRIDLDANDASFLARKNGAGLRAEIDWWEDYQAWATDGDSRGPMADAYAWVRATAPDDPSLAVTWGDTRFANASFDEQGAVVGLLDWEQAALAPAELDLGWFFAIRRITRGAMGVTADPELPGFLDRAETIAHVETALGRPLRHLAWHETFAAIRMGTCVVATQRVLRRAGRLDHFLLQAERLPDWAIAEIA